VISLVTPLSSWPTSNRAPTCGPQTAMSRCRAELLAGVSPPWPRLLGRDWRAPDPAGPDKALQLISLLANFLSQISGDQQDSSVVALPQAALTRTARFLEATALMARNTDIVTPDLLPSSARELAGAFDRDAKILRDLVAEHGLPDGPLTPG
jgi:hypothetical protein